MPTLLQGERFRRGRPLFQYNPTGKGAYLWREVCALRKKNVMYVIGEVILLPRLLIWNIHRIVIVKAGPAQWQITDHRLEIFDLHIS